MTEPRGTFLDTARLSAAQQALLERRLRERGGASPIRPRRGSGAARLSFAQQRLWLLDQLEDGFAAYNVPRLLRVGANLDVPTLRAVLDTIVERHEVLRSVVVMEGGEPVQEVRAPRPVELAYFDLSAEPGEREPEVERLVLAEASRPFALAHDQLLRALLIRVGQDDDRLLLVVHHIASDAASRTVLLRELTELYDAFAGSAPPRFVPLPLQYADYAAWQREQLTGPKLDRLLAYWSERLAGAPSFHQLPTDRIRPLVETHRGARMPVHLDRRLVDRLKQLSREHEVTLFMLLLAAVGALVGRMSGEEDVVIGTPISGRAGPELDGLMGLFANTLVLRVDLSGDPSFAELLARTRETAVSAYAHQDLPFERLVEALNPARDLSHAPLVQIMFELEQGGAQPPALAGSPLELEQIDLGWTKFDLTLGLSERDDGLVGTFEYATDLFDSTTIAALARRLELLLEAAAASPASPVSTLPLLVEEEREELLGHGAATAADYLRSPLHELVAAQARRTPDAVSVVGTDWTLSYAELDAWSNLIAHRLISAGVERESLVGICLERSAGMVAGLLGVLKAGAAYVPLDPAFPPDRLAFMVEDAGLVALLAEESTLGCVPWDPGLPLVRLDDDASVAEVGSTSAPAVVVDAEQLAYVIYTSGSTGRPKGVEISHRALVNLVQSVAREPGIGRADVLVAVTTLSFDIAALELFTPLVVGGRVVIASTDEARDPTALAALLEHNAATVMQATPTTWRLLLDSGWPGRPGMRALCGGEALPQMLADGLCGLDLQLWNMYGPTETTIWSTLARIRPGDVVSIGRPLANTTVYVLDAAGQPVPPGVVGELLIGGDGLARGYHARPDLTAERFVAHPFVPGARLYRTGDLARRLRDGRIECLGRIDGQVKLRGFRIELGEVEAVLESHPAVRAALAVVRDDDRAGERLIAYVVGDAVGEEVLRAQAESLLPVYMVPSTIVLLDALPLTPNGKIDRKALPAPAPTDEPLSRPPRTPTEEALCAIFADALGLAQIGIDDDFFRSGGHSLLAARVVTRVRSTFGVELELRAIFATPTVAGLASVVDEALRGDRPPLASIELLAQRAGLLPVSSSQERVWYLDRLTPGTPLWNVPLALRSRGPLSPTLLEQALDALVDRHEILRAAIVEADGRPYLRVEPALHLRLSHADVSATADPQAAALRAAESAARAPFDLARTPLLRALLVRIGPDDHLLVLVLHHVLVDGFSLGVIRSDLQALYGQLSGSVDGAPPPLRIQYADYAAWQRARLEGEAFDRELDYWRGRLETAPAVLELPADRPRPAVQSHRGSRLAVVYDLELLEGLRGVARTEGVTLYMVLLAAFSTLLHRYSGRNDLVVGTPVANRSHEETERLVGFFANTLALRLDVNADEPFRALLAQTRATAVDAYAHAELPFETLVEALRPERSLSYTPVFQVLFAMQNRLPAAPAKLELEPVGLDPGTARFDLTLSVTEREDGLRVSFEFATDLFDRETIERMSRHLEVLLRGIARDPGSPVGRLPLLTEDERRHLVAGPSSAGCESRPVLELFAEQTASRPAAAAVCFEDDRLTYAELDERSARLARHLQALGVGVGSLVGVWVERHIDLMTAILGVLRAGAAYVPLEPTYPVERLAFMVADAGLQVLVTPTGADRIRGLPVERGLVVSLVDDAEAVARHSAEPLEPAATPSDLAYVIYTSGSTGVPKGVQIEHGSLANLVASMSRRPGLGAGDALAAITTPAFDLSVPDLFLPLAVGGRIVFASREVATDGERLGALLEKEDVLVMQATATTWRLLIAAGWVGRPGFRALCGGEAIPPEVVSELHERAASVWHAYGPTEATVWCAIQEVERGAALTLGPPIDNMSLYVLDARLQPVPAGVVGEVCVGGRGVARGYLDRSELTAERFVTDPFASEPGARLYRTGDLGRVRRDGTIEFLGRADEQVKLRGFRIELGEIESVLCADDEVDEAVVVLRDERLVGYVVAAGSELDAAGLRGRLAASLPEYMVPPVIVRLERLPLTANGKVDRRALPAPDAVGLSAEEAYLAPRSLLEERVAELFGDILGRERIGVHDEFFALGGHSLMVTRLVSRIRDAYGIELPLRTVYERPTVAGIAEAVSAGLVRDDVELEALLAELETVDEQDRVRG